MHDDARPPAQTLPTKPASRSAGGQPRPASTGAPMLTVQHLRQITIVSLVVAALSLLTAVGLLLRPTDPFAASGGLDAPPPPPPGAPAENIKTAAAQAIGTGYLTIDTQSQPSPEGIVTLDVSMFGKRCHVEVLTQPGTGTDWMPAVYTPMTATCG